LAKTTLLTHLGNAWLDLSIEKFKYFLKIRRGPQSDTSGSYVLILEDSTAKGGRLIIVDTPGLGDTGGVVKDVQNVNNILQAFLRLRHLNAVLFLGKGSDSRYTDRMQIRRGEDPQLLPEDLHEQGGPGPDQHDRGSQL